MTTDTLEQSRSTTPASPPGWPRVRFGDVVRNVNNNARNPLESGIERYVGLDHLDPESLHIKRWGMVAEGTTFTRTFTAGQVLFGKRRAYQRKAAVAEFDGVCSGDILVFEPSGGELLSELLPFIVQSAGFFNHALGTSAGSLSPRTRWKDLAVYEFALPPRDEQRRIAEILWAADAAIELYIKAQDESKKTLTSATEHLMQFGLNASPLISNNRIAHFAHWNVQELQEIATVERGRFAHRPRNLPQFYGGPYPFVQTGDVANTVGILTDFEQTLSEEGKVISRSFGSGSILMTIAAIIGKTAVTNFEIWCTDSVVGIVPSEKIDVFFLEFYLRTIQRYLEEKVATQTAQKNINLAVLRPLRIPVPPMEEQKQISETLLSIQGQTVSLGEHIKHLRVLKETVLRELLLAN